MLFSAWHVIARLCGTQQVRPLRTSMDANLSSACDNYLAYLEKILRPSAESFLQMVSSNKVQLHNAFGINLFLAHAVDYIHAIRLAAGTKESRKELVQGFDSRFGVTGSRVGSRKFEMIDALNNALKHIQLDEARYRALTEQYGTISFNCLVPDDGRVLCILEGYRFDYSRVVLRPAIEALSGWHFSDLEDVLDFANGDAIFENCPAHIGDDDDPIDQMITYCNPVCDDCAEPETDCLCATFVYDGEKGAFAHNFNHNFDAVMSRISGAYRKDA